MIEGFIDTEYLEPEAPFGESHGHVNLQEFNAYMDVTCITRRRDAVLTSIISQVTPSESSLIKRIGMEPLFLNFLRNMLGIKGIKRVSMHEPLTNIRKVIVVVCERDMPATEVWRALYGTAVAAPRRRQIRHRRQRRHRSGKRRRAVLGDVLPRQPDARHAHPAASRPGPRPAQRAQRRPGRLGADRRDAEGRLSADLPAQARIHGERQEDLGRAGPAQAQAGNRPGSAIRSANGRRNSTPPPRAPPRANISRQARCSPSAAARTCA